MAAERITILYFSHYFPPLGGIAALRSLKMVKYLADQGIDCVVLSANPIGLREPKDRSLISEIPARTVIHRYWTPDIRWLYKALWGLKLNQVVDFLSQYVFCPDVMVSALPFAWLKLKLILSRNARPKLVYISGGPFSQLTLGPKLKARFGVEYICEWRDEWTNNGQSSGLKRSSSALRREQKQEEKVLFEAIAHVFLTELMHKNFTSAHPGLSNKGYRIIPNGYDEADFQSLQTRTTSSARLRILYTGSFYDRRQPDNLWQAVSELVRDGQLDPQQVEIKIIGRNTIDFVLGSFVSDEMIRSMVLIKGFITHGETLIEMQTADVLLIYIPSGPNSASVLTGKLFEYLRTGKAILTIAPPKGLAAKIVTEAGTGFVADFDDISSIKEQVHKLYISWKQGSLKLIKSDQSYISRFSRQEQARQLADLIREIL